MLVYDSVPVSPGTETKMNLMRNAFANLHTTIEALAPASRERSVALTNLEQAAMWAIKSITHNQT